MLNFKKFVVLMIMGDYDVDLVIVVLWVMLVYCFVIRHMCLVLSVFLCYILLFVHLKVLFLLMQKNCEKTCGKYTCYACLSVNVCMYCACVIDSF